MVIEPGNVLKPTHPDRSIGIGTESVRRAGWYGSGIMADIDERFNGLPIKPTQPIIRTNPDKSVPILREATYVSIRQAVSYRQMLKGQVIGLNNSLRPEANGDQKQVRADNRHST